MKPEKLAKHFRVDDPERFRLDSIDPADTCGFDLNKDEAKAMLVDDIRRLSDLQERLYADDRWSLLVVLQAMDAAGKDGVIKHVMTGLNPQGCVVHSFKAPSSSELDHDFLWRAAQYLPPRGDIGIFNRSHYEEVLVVRVHPELLDRQGLPPEARSRHLWDRRFRAINEFERSLVENGVHLVKLFLHLSREEQRRRFLDRIETP